MDGNDSHDIEPNFYKKLVKYGTPWVKKDVKSEFYPRFETDGETFVDANGAHTAKRYFNHIWAEFYDAERRLANETRQKNASNCKDQAVFQTYWFE